jgi:hypothetical protein
LNNNTAGVREREDANRTREAGSLDEIQGVAANTLNLFRNGAVGFIDWLDVIIINLGLAFKCGHRATPTKPDITQTGHIEIREVDIVSLPHRLFSNG